MKTIIAGSRWIEGTAALFYLSRCIRELPWAITEVVSGRARGVDRLGERWARARHIPVTPFSAVWYDRDGEYDPKAGFKRNVQMADYADALLAIWDCRSNGTEHMISTARDKGLRVVVRVWHGDGLD